MKKQITTAVTRYPVLALLLVVSLLLGLYLIPRAIGERMSKPLVKANASPKNEAPAGNVVLDHFKAYIIPNAPPANQMVRLKDQFDPQFETRTVLQPAFWANPVQKRVGKVITQITNPVSHLELYNINPVAAPVRLVQVLNQFFPDPANPQRLQLGNSKFLAVPTQKNQIGTPHDLDHFKCYECMGSPVNIPVFLTDQFTNPNETQHTVGVPRYFCNPVTKIHDPNTVPRNFPNDHLVFYDITPQTFATNITALNQFPPMQNLPIQTAVYLGVPSQKIVLDHFKAYPVVNPTPFPTPQPRVQLQDQFDYPLFDNRRVIVPFRFANPVMKRNLQRETNTPAYNLDSHLKLYKLSPVPTTESRTLTVTNQFLPQPQPLTVFSSTLLAVPTQKNGSGTVHDLDHFKCYDCTGNPVNVPVALFDQFHPFPNGETNVVVLQPEYLCNPVVKKRYVNGQNVTTPILYGEAHLVLYKINQQPAFNIAVNTLNQFGSETDLQLREADYLAVPSSKATPAPTPTPPPPTVTTAVSRKVHGAAGTFDIDLPLAGPVGIECRSGGATNDYTIVVTFSGPVTGTGMPAAQVVLGTADIGSGGASNGGFVDVDGNVVTIPLTNAADQQTINVRLNSVNAVGNDVIIPMGRLLADGTGNGSVNAGDVSQTKSRIGQVLTQASGNYRSDFNESGGINAGDVSIAKANVGHALPP